MSWENLLKHCKLSVVKKLVYTIDKSGFYLSGPMQNKGLASELEDWLVTYYVLALFSKCLVSSLLTRYFKIDKA